MNKPLILVVEDDTSVKNLITTTLKAHGYRYLTAVTPYVDACELQFGSKTYNMYVDDGNLLYEVLQLVKQRRQIP